MFFNPDFYSSSLSYADEEIILSGDAAVLPEQSALATPEASEARDAEIAVVTSGRQDSNIVENTLLTLNMLHLGYVTADSIQDIGGAQIAIITAPDFDGDDLDALKDFLANGGKIVFAAMPRSPSQALIELLGITSYTPDYDVTAVEIHDGILLGGMLNLEEMLIDCAGITLSGRCKVFAHGYPYPGLPTSGRVTDETLRTPIIWRTYHEGGAIYVVNAPFMERPGFAGILTGVLSLAYEDFIYPIVGTKTLILDNFPYIADDGAHVGGRTVFSYMRDIVWPDLINLTKTLDLGYTCYTNGEFSRNPESAEILGFFNSEFYKVLRGELGYSTERLADNNAALESDAAFLRESLSNYSLRSVMLPADTGTPDLSVFEAFTSAASMSPDGAFTWLGNRAVRLPVISAGTGGDESQFVFTSTASAFGFAMHSIDMAPLFTGEQAWNLYSRAIGDHLTYLLYNKDYLSAASVKSAAESLKDYLNTDLSVSRYDGGITVSMRGNLREILFILRSGKEVDTKRSDNCTIRRLGEDEYLITSDGPEFSVKFM